MDTDKLIEKYLIDTVDAMSALYEKNLYGHLLILIFSSIDAMGLLDAPLSQSEATGDSFKEWVKKYILDPDTSLHQFNEIDFWAARCAVLHTYTSQSRLSNSGSAREIQYYTGPKDSPEAKTFITQIQSLGNGYVIGHLEDIYNSYLEGISKFSVDLSTNCTSNERYKTRVNNVLMTTQLNNTQKYSD